ncbi:STAS/SEC14 domain-containing protein [Maricaulis maris]|jgi:SpoIIAA-like|uniref:STAS/SEC14 domain-containing protein n=1 Tax=Maricaulis maris TaxID=74318 RepID=UPI00292438DA|nr:hypothetical protein MACH15_19390 [Maricaulis maris]
MILVETGETSGVVVAKAVGTLSASDYSDALVPGLEAAIAAHGPVAMLYWFGPEFDGFTAGAMWADMRLGLDHLKDITRIAVVTDDHVMAAMVQGTAIFLPMPVRVFGNDALGAANKWLLADDPAKG